MSDLLLIIIEQFLLYTPLMVGAYISFNLLSVPDFSIESAFIFGALAAVKILPSLTSLPTVFQLIVACLTASTAGSIVGLLSGSCTQYLQLNHALSAIITLGLFQGVNYFLLGAGHQSLTHFYNPLIVIDFFPKSPELISLVFISAFFIVIISALFSTQLGYCFAAYGHNNRFFKNYGISSRFVFISGLMVSNACGGLSGYLIAQSNRFIDSTMGFGMPLMCLGVLMLGSLLISKNKSMTIALPLTGLLVYLFLQQLLLKLGCTSLYFSAAQALIILVGTIITRRAYGLSVKNR